MNSIDPARTYYGISKSHLSNILNGRRRLTWKVAERIAPLFNLKPEFLMRATPEKLKQLHKEKFNA